MEQIPKYIRNKNHPESISYASPLLKPILSVTYGCMVYQEQVMQIVRDLGGYSLGRSDLVRRAMSKKKKDVMEEERQKFVYGGVDSEGRVIIPGAIRNGVDEKTANSIFDEMMDFASYAFNKSHAAAYAVVGYQTAWLKHYYTVEFMAALLNSFMGTPGKISQYVQDCRKMAIQVLPPDINESDEGFAVAGGKIRFGLAAVKNVGYGIVRQIIFERHENGIYKGLPDLCERLDGRDINKRCLESLIRSGAFDSLKIYRSKLLNSYETIMDNISHARKVRMEGQLSLFGNGDGSSKDSFIDIQYPDIEEYDSRLLLAMEKEMLGLYISGHPLSEYEDEIKNWVTLYSIDLVTEEKENEALNDGSPNTNVKDGTFVRVAGIVIEMKTITTRSNQLMAFVTIEDMTGQMEVIVFPNTLEKYGDILKPEVPVWIEGKLSVREDEAPKVITEMVKPIIKGESIKATEPRSDYKVSGSRSNYKAFELRPNNNVSEPGLGHKVSNTSSNQQSYQQANQQANQQSYQQANRQVNRQVNRQAYQQTTQQLNQQASQQVNRQAYQQANQQVNRQAYQQANRQEDQQVNRQANQQSYQAGIYCLKVRIPEGTSEKTASSVVALLRYFEGNTAPVYLYHGDKTHKKFRVFFNTTLFEELKRMLGEINVKYEKVPIKKH
jgi:DNA polymerase III alpha subunit